jgi:ASC-1-like (ASCH) protein
MADMASKRKALISYVQSLSGIDPNGTNVKRYVDMFTNMSDKELTTFMTNMREGRVQFNFSVPNMTKRISLDQILATAKKVDVKLFDYVWFYDKELKTHYRSRHKLPILRLPLRRMQQFLDKKLSVPDSDRRIDMITGQVTGKDRASSVTAPEIQALSAKGLKNTLNELVTVRGGDINAYGSFRAMLEETGSASLKNIPGGSVSRTAQVASVLLAGMHIDSNLIDE